MTTANKRVIKGVTIQQTKWVIRGVTTQQTKRGDQMGDNSKQTVDQRGDKTETKWVIRGVTI